MDTYDHLKQQKDEIERQQRGAKDARIAELEKALREIHDEADYSAGANFNPELAAIAAKALRLGEIYGRERTK